MEQTYPIEESIMTGVWGLVSEANVQSPTFTFCKIKKEISAIRPQPQSRHPSERQADIAVPAKEPGAISDQPENHPV